VADSDGYKHKKVPDSGGLRAQLPHHSGTIDKVQYFNGLAKKGMLAAGRKS
jgi:hypothetical protein